jgi:hypothetical protein
VGLTAIFAGYLTVWLPGPAAGLTFLGLEVGEWIKFLGVGPRRNLFYLPPITLGLMLALITTTWPNERRQTWLMRGLAVVVALLALPAFESMRDEPSSEWLLRLQLIALVLLVALLSGALGQGGKVSSLALLPWLLLVLVAIVGALLPTWVYLAVRPVVGQAIGRPIGIGLGVWLNVVGHLLVAAVSLWRLTLR